MNILVTGGTGYIGSHTVVELINHGYDVTIIDNLYNSKENVLDKIEKITGKRPTFYNADIRNYKQLEDVISKNKFDACIHFAGLKAVGESCEKPMLYFDNNVSGSINLYDLLIKNNVNTIIFSSSATVYGDNFKPPFKEEFGQGTATNPYGQTKAINENILTSICQSNKNMSCCLLRYFNPIGAHESGLIGEIPNGVPNNLLPYICDVANGKRDHLNIFGNDYDTKDGTCIRDFIHVVDLARAHVLALEYSLKHKGVEVINIGTGNGYTVSEVVKAYEKASGVKIKVEIAPRRAGDIAISFADVSKAEKLLGFKTEFDIEKMCEDSYRFSSQNKI